ncbi:hypothetical protein NCS57_01202200 [Fusarium keratoplasticum]|uniref:Uncharacterized protein n=1 Tax=Fusarium keratoplasticum TaxID=1328300 RepID=A0ACC0QG89_9HYPO|nr:hypothetical protein NCS57_01202200 [Fusarium keratoplasticum]KAI8654557.1 hypothetical protein NCS57_01202200 [Fusarium keratoplasticum]
MRLESASLAGLLAVAKAQSITIDGVLFAYQTATITECFPMGGSGLDPTRGLSIGGNAPIIHRPAVTGQPIIVEVDAPRCNSCGCDACAHTEVYTFTCDAFCDTGLCKQAYVVTETYSGMTAKPTLAPTDLPFGFTCDVQTCTTCGPEPITATITYPLTERLYINKMPAPTGVPGAKKPAAYSPPQAGAFGFHYESDYASGADSTGVGSYSGSDSGGSSPDADSDSNANPNGGYSDSGSNADSHSQPESGPGSGSSPSSNDNSHYGSNSDAYPNANSDSGYKAGSNSHSGPGSGSDAGSQPGSQPGWQPGPGVGSNAKSNTKQNTGSDSASNYSPELPPSDDRPVYVSSASKSIVILTLGFTSLVSFTFLALISL